MCAVIAGTATSPLTTALALDLERRGFIVYVITSSAEDEQHVRNQSRVDLLPLNLDVVYVGSSEAERYERTLTSRQPDTAQEQLSRFHHLLARHHHAFEGAPSHRLTLAGVILVPDTQSAVGSVSDLSPDIWSQALHSVHNSITRMQLLLPLVTSFKSRVLVLTPSVIPSLRPPHHAVESTVSSALEAFTSTLAAELAHQDLSVCHFKLGDLDLFPSRPLKSSGKSVRGTSMRRLHDAVFDALRARRPSRTWHVGRGSLAYDVIGGWLPAGVVGWMMGLQRQNTAPPVPPHVQHAIEDVAAEQEREDEGSDSVQWEKVEQNP